MADLAHIPDEAETSALPLYSGGGRNPGRCTSSAIAPPWAPAFAGEPQEGCRG